MMIIHPMFAKLVNFHVVKKMLLIDVSGGVGVQFRWEEGLGLGLGRKRSGEKRKKVQNVFV